MIEETQQNFMSQNVGTIDRGIRILLGLGLIAIVFVGPETNWGWLGLIPLLTGIVGVCPSYRLMGVDTCGKEGVSKR